VTWFWLSFCSFGICACKNCSLTCWWNRPLFTETWTILKTSKFRNFILKVILLVNLDSKKIFEMKLNPNLHYLGNLSIKTYHTRTIHKQFYVYWGGNLKICLRWDLKPNRFRTGVSKSKWLAGRIKKVKKYCLWIFSKIWYVEKICKTDWYFLKS